MRLRRMAAVFGLFGASCGVILAFGGYYPKALLTLAIARILLGLFGFMAAIRAVFAAYRDPPRGVY
jgi:cation transporter-like permease